MSDLYGTGCHRCCKELAAVQAMPSYLNVDGYVARYHTLPLPWPKPYIDGVFMEEVTGTIEGEDGWLVRNVTEGSIGPEYPPGARHVVLCECGSGELKREVWRGKVGIL